MPAVDPALQTLPIGAALPAVQGKGAVCTDAIPRVRKPNLLSATKTRGNAISPHDVQAIPPGTVLAGRYRIVRKVAEGGMGIIYEAEDQLRMSLADDRARVALKFTKPLPGCNGESARALLDEHARALTLSHENIVKVHNFEQDGEQCFFVMEWLDGEPLRTCGATDTLRGNSRQLIDSIACGLAAAHEQGVVHADVQPANIIVTKAGAVKLVDFGNIRRTFLYEGGSRSEYRATANYASPQVLAGKVPAASDDVFALGIIAYELLTGTRPFGKHNALEARVLELEPAPLEAIDRSLADAVMRCLEYSRETRFPDAGQFLQAVNYVQHPVAIMPRPTARRRPFAPAAAAATILVALASIIWTQRAAPVAETVFARPGATGQSAARLIVPIAPAAAETPSALPAEVPAGALAIADLEEVRTLDMRDDAVAILAVVAPDETSPPAEAIEAEAVATERPVQAITVLEPTAAPVMQAADPVGQTASVPAPPPGPVSELAQRAVKHGKNHWLQQVLSQAPVSMSSLAVQHYEAPAYPRMAREQGIAGKVDVSFAVAPNGQPVGIGIQKAEPLGTFDDAALAAVREWRFHSVDGGKHVKVRLRFIPDAS